MVLTPLAVILVAIFIGLLEFYNHHPLVEGLGRVADLALLHPKVVLAIPIDKISVEVGAFSADGYGITQFCLIACKEYAVDEVQHKYNRPR